MESKKKFIFLTMALGIWLIAFALTFAHLGYSDCVPFFISDLLSGCALIALSILIYVNYHPTGCGWLVGLVGLWLQFAPVVLWAQSSLAYLNDTLIGALAVVFAFELTRQAAASSSADCPKGWSYNPSTWKHRLPTVGLAMLCWFFARYMAAYQLGYISEVWDPFFGDGTLRVITSNVSRSFPVSDAGLGALFYTLEALLGWQGDERRWQTMPWLVLAFGFLVIPVGIVSIMLIILQPIAVGAWCTWCLLTALCMLLMILLTAGELAAALQFLYESRQRGESPWKVLWQGGKEVGRQSSQTKGRESWGISVPWSLAVSAIAGLILMALPALLQFNDRLAMSDYIEGPLVFAISVIAMAEAFRGLRYLLVAFGAWLFAAPWCLTSPGALTFFFHVVIGILLIFQIWDKTKVKERFGSWESLIV